MHQALSNDPADAPAGNRSLGTDLRALRKSRGLTLQQLAARVQRSIGFLSQVERGLSSPSIADLRTLADALQVPVSWFFAQQNPADGGVVVRGANRRALGTRESGIVEELLSPDLGGSFEMLRSIFAAGAESAGEVRRDTEEAGYLVSGSLHLWIDGAHFELRPGDSFRFENKRYRWKNSGSEDAVMIWVVSPPVY